MSLNQVTLSNSPTPPTSAYEKSIAIINTGGGIARIGLSISSDITNLAFETAKFSTRTSMTFSKSIVSNLGISTSPLDFIESITISGINLGHRSAALSLECSAEIVRVWQQLLGDSFSFELANGIVSMVYETFSNHEMNIFDTWKYISGWISLQTLTKEKWKEEFIFPSVEVMPQATQLNKKKWKISNLFKRDHFAFDGFPSDQTSLIPVLKRVSKFANGCYGEM